MNNAIHKTWSADDLAHWRETPARQAVAKMSDEMREAFEERAAILEFEAGFSRIDAEAHALASLLI